MQIDVISNYQCSLSKVAFNSLVEELKNESAYSASENSSIAFVDGDANTIHTILSTVYEKRRNSKRVHLIALVSDQDKCSALIHKFSDLVLVKKISYDELKVKVKSTISSPPKILSDLFFGDVWGHVLKKTRKEYHVLNLLFDGYTQVQVSKMMNLSVKTISGYKVKAVKRHGARTFNELYMRKINGC